MSLFREMSCLYETIKPNETIFVLDSSIGQVAYDHAKAFNTSIGVGSVILTKLDSGVKAGGAISAIAATGSPITFIGTGEHMDDLEPFNPESFIKQILGQGNVRELVKKINQENIQDSQEILIKMQSGRLCLRDLQNQFKNVLKLGSVNSIMKLIPGLNDLDKNSGDESQKRIKRFLTLMDSMTNNG